MSLVPFYVSRYLFNGDEAETLIWAFVGMTFYMFINLTILHLIFTKIGWLYVEVEVLAQGNEQLLNNFDEGVIILNEASHEVMFANDAAKRIRVAVDSGVNSESLLVSVNDILQIDFSESAFAEIDEDWFK